MSIVIVLFALTASAIAAETATSSSKAASPSASPPPAPPSPAEEQERDSSLALFLVLFLLIFSFFASYYLRVKRITAIHETIVGLFAGMLVGAILRIGPGEQVQQMLSFSNTIMLNVLLPPIILASGYDLRQENFFRNFGTILVFAFAGTFISAIVIGVLVYLWSLADFTISLSILDCLIFGSTLSATDPVTILAIFNSKKVDPTLYSIIFGESLLNDAVSIVMFDTLSTFRGQNISIYSLFNGIGLFLVVFGVSMALGVCFGLGCSLMLKHSRLSMYTQLESCLVALIAYTSYFFSNAVTMSGIVSLLFCGITLKHYAYHNMSRRTQRATRYIFQTLASLSENFIFIYLGLSLFTQENLVFKPLFIVVTIAAVIFSRYVAVFPIAHLINLFRRVRGRRADRRSGGGGIPRTGNEDQLSREYQIMLFWAGLRGAVGFALSAGIEGNNALALQTTVLVTIVLTLIAFGGTTSQMLDILGIRTGVQDDEGDSSDEDVDAGRPGGSHVGMGNVRNRRGYSGRKRAAGAGASRYAAAGSYRDDEVFIPKGSSASGARGNDSPRYSYEEDESSQDESDVLPSASTRDGANGSGSGGGFTIGPDGFPEAFTGSSRAAGGARALLERGALIMRDGQWFQKIDDRYLKPYFSNAVASRKHEERKSLRAASRSHSNQGSGSALPSSHTSPTGSSSNILQHAGGSSSAGLSGGANDEAALWEAEALSREPDADIFPASSSAYSEDGDDELLGLGMGMGTSRSATPLGGSSSISGAAGSGAAGGRATPRRPNSVSGFSGSGLGSGGGNSNGAGGGGGGNNDVYGRRTGGIGGAFGP
ncbi:sodium/hydrogen exchanger [Microstroma glucosiphilum]|uniref:Sodium/hydrogen exchanger n=1 Tax=Pseudomicrostroma glucosiphilum TaxID=1684307 RepID=A0A316U653_9BASI|nr:sodium/hydrogen exchanger [Pseudomicrostroma glucosiphilum]PWN20709.1 sodium/hydrogen exchanger [Pseudomicrostroma glucosiphilum]